MNFKKLIPLFVVMMLPISGCSNETPVTSSSGDTPTSDSSTSIIPPGPSGSTSVVPSPQITLNKTELELDIYGSSSFQLVASIVPEGEYQISWKSMNTAVVSVSSSGLVNALSVGETTVSASVTIDGTTYKAYCDVSVVNTDPSSKEDYKAYFDEAREAILNGHNYRIDVYSTYEGNPGDPYENYYLMINDRAYCNKYFESLQGIIYQKDQGYLNFFLAGEEVIDKGFFSTNSSVGVSEIYDLTAEQLLKPTYVQDSVSYSKFTTKNSYALDVASSFTGFSTSSWFTPPTQLIVEARPSEKKLIVNVNFKVYYYDEGEHYVDGLATLTISGIGETTNEVIENYVENPTIDFPVRTAWNDDDKELFDRRNAGVYPVFPTGASYAFSCEEILKEGFNRVMISDLASGDLTTSYGAQLIGDGYEKGSDGIYTKVIINESESKKTTLKVELQFIPSSIDEVLFPHGEFRVFYRGDVTNSDIDTVEKFNAYLSANGYDEVVPLIPEGHHITKISQFEDVTAQKNAEAGKDLYLFYTSTKYIKFYVNNYLDAISDINAYVALVKEKGFTVETPYIGGYINYTNQTDFTGDSYVSIPNPNNITESNYKGYFTMRYYVENYKEEEKPDLYKIEVTEAGKTVFSVGETFAFNGKVYATYRNPVDYKKVDNSLLEFSGYDMSKSGEQTVTISFTFNEVTKTTTYKIYVLPEKAYETSFKTAGVNITAKIYLCEDGTGIYSYDRPGAGRKLELAKFSYKIESSVITFTFLGLLTTDQFTAFDNYFLFPGDVEGVTKRDGVYGGSFINVKLSHYDGKWEQERMFTIES